MEKNKISTDKKLQQKNGITKDIKTVLQSENITILDLTDRGIVSFDENVNFPPNLLSLIMKRNNLKEVPTKILELRNLKTLDLSFNSILYFDDRPEFFNSIEQLVLSNNHLEGPPYWIWLEAPGKLKKLDLSCNPNITTCFQECPEYFNELLQYTTLVSEVTIFNCRINNYVELFKTFSNAKVLNIGYPEISNYLSNHLDDLPSKGLVNCCHIKSLNVSNTNIYNILSNIDIYENLIELDLSHNKINGLPAEFCNLSNLEVCNMSHNSLLYLPDDMVKLKRLRELNLNCNQLCMLPENICDLLSLKVLDIYSNSVYEVPEGIKSLLEYDLAQNYFEEPIDAEYLEKKAKIRFNSEHRLDGRKIEVEKAESQHSSSTTDAEELLSYYARNQNVQEHFNHDSSSSEDWDADEYWVPQPIPHRSPPPLSPWMYYVKQKMSEGNFCPMDAHQVPVIERVRYERLCNPKEQHVVEGQFDDLSEDDS